MRVWKIAVAAAAAASLSAMILASPAMAGSKTSRVTGGGQVVLSGQDLTGAGDTLAFTAQNTRSTSDDATAATGQLQYVQRSGSSQVVAHADVTCLSVDGNMATLEGTWQSGPYTHEFWMQVTDSDQGTSQNTGTDTIQFQPNDSDQEDSFAEGAQCGPGRNNNDDNGPNYDLARGNVQVYQAGS
jgi:hypothetical protein